MSAVTMASGLRAILEVGCEELPAALLPGTLAAIEERARTALASRRLAAAGVTAGGTPVRLVLRLEGLALRTEEERSVIAGPPLKAAGDWPTNPSAAVSGFARTQGVPVEALEVVELPKGAYLAVRKTIPSQASFEVLPEIFSEVLSGLSFPKAMRWGRGTGPFLRPVLWILALCGDEVAGFEFAGQVSGRLTFAPRYRGGAPVLLRDVAQYDREMKGWDVEIDPVRRRERIWNDLELSLKIERSTESWPDGLALLPDPGLLEEVSGLVEGFRIIPAVLPEKYRALPPAVIRTVLRVHQRFFVASDRAGGVVAHFLGVSGNPSAPLETVRDGYVRVVTARLEDAAYYIHRDRARTLASRVPDLDSVSFFPGVGSLGEKSRATGRLIRTLLPHLPDPLFRGRDRAFVLAVLDRAAALYKTDLLTGLVKEFPELEGEVGGHYLREEAREEAAVSGRLSSGEGLDEAVALAVASHYEPRTFRDPVPSDPISALLSLCDRAVGQAGAFLGGASPTGSLDPFALRRGAAGMLRILIEHALPVRLSTLADLSIGAWERAATAAGESVRAPLLAFWEDRLLSLLSPEGDLLWGRAGRIGDEPPAVSSRRVTFLRSFFASPEFLAMETVKTRIERILPSDWGTPDLPVSLPGTPEETVLLELLRTLSRTPFPDFPDPGDFSREAQRVAPLLPAVQAVFDAVLVNDPDPAVRASRLSLLGAVSRRLSCFGALELLGSQAKKERPAG